jgi:hypothetical protein
MVNYSEHSEQQFILGNGHWLLDVSALAVFKREPAEAGTPCLPKG